MAASSGGVRGLHPPSAEEMLQGVLILGRNLHLETSERQLVGRFLDVLRGLFPSRYFLVRTIEWRTHAHTVVHGRDDRVRPGIETERLTLKPSAIERTKLKPAVVESAGLRTANRWDSPFVGVASGFSVPLVASGELYGLLDIGYDLGVEPCAEDESAILPIANQLSVALRSLRLYSDANSLRDYQATLIESARALILGVDCDWRITVCNQALCHLASISREEAIGFDVRDRFPGGWPALMAVIRRVLSGGSAESAEVELARANGDAVRTTWSVAPIRSRGKILSVVCIGQDQTIVRELQGQVIQAEKLATLGQLAAGVVHELNNPLTSISVYAEYLHRKAEGRCAAGEEDAAEDVEKLARIMASAQRIQAFARDLVQYAKPATREFETTSVNTVVKQALLFCEHLFQRAGIELREQLSPDIRPISAVPGQLEQVVINLVTNAIQACDSSGTVTVTTSSRGEDRVLITVADTGPGICPEHRERIFEPFFTTKTDGRGTGLGLSIVRSILEQHGGDLDLVSELGQGAEFCCVLPVNPSS